MFAEFRFGDLVYRIGCESEEEARELEEWTQSKVFELMKNRHFLEIKEMQKVDNLWVLDFVKFCEKK